MVSSISLAPQVGAAASLGHPILIASAAASLRASEFPLTATCFSFPILRRAPSKASISLQSPRAMQSSLTDLDSAAIGFCTLFPIMPTAVSHRRSSGSFPGAVCSIYQSPFEPDSICFLPP